LGISPLADAILGSTAALLEIRKEIGLQPFMDKRNQLRKK